MPRWLYQANDWEGGVEGRVAEHEPAVVDRDRDVVEHQGEDHLYDSDDKASVDDKLAHYRGALVGLAPVPEEELLQCLELEY